MACAVMSVRLRKLRSWSAASFAVVKYGGVYGKGEARADVVVDASGPTGILATKLKLRKSSPCAPGIAIESIVEDKAVVRSLKKFKNTLSFYLGSEYVRARLWMDISFRQRRFQSGMLRIPRRGSRYRQA